MGGGATDTNSEIFNISGPFHLTSIEWTNSYHRTSVASSLVKGVYILERDRRKKRVGPKSLANPWWEFFHFTLCEILVDPDDSSIYGAIFEYDLYKLYQSTPDLKVPPRFVVAFRGTNISPKTFMCDAKLDLRCVFNSLHRGSRFKHAIEEIKTIVAKYQEPAIWLAGHSLGAALALLMGKTMIKSEIFPEAHIFNPPISSAPLDQLLKSKKLTAKYRFAKSVVKATTAIVLKDLQVKKEEDHKAALWIPYLYVNKADPICSEYIGYFKNKILMSVIGASKIERTGARISLRSKIFGRIRSSSSSNMSTEPLHLLPSAYLTVNMNKLSGDKLSHGIHQWWEKDSALRANWETQCIRPRLEDEIGKLLN